MILKVRSSSLVRFFRSVASAWRGESAFFIFCLGLCLFIGLLSFVIPLLAWIHDSMEYLRVSSLFEPSLLAVVRFTVKQMLISTLISAGAGLSLGVFLGRLTTHVKAVGILSAFAIPLAVPTVVSALGWMSFLGRSFDLLYSQKAVILAHCFYNIPLVILAVAQARRVIHAQSFDAIRSLGGSRWDEWRIVVWPEVKWPFLSACAQTASFCAMSFALVLILGGGPPVQTLETEIFYRIKFGQYDPEGALSCAFWEFALTLVPWAIVAWAENRQRRDGVSVVRGTSFRAEQRTAHPSPNIFLRGVKKTEWSSFFWVGLISIFFLVPYFFVLEPQALKTFLRKEFLVQVASATAVSFQMAFLTSSGVVGLSALLVVGLRFTSVSEALKRGVRILVGAPSGVSVFILGLGVALAYGRWIDPFEGSGVALVALQGCIFFPLAFRLLWPVLKQEDSPSWSAARSLGASWRQAFWMLEWPRWQAPLLSVWSGVFGACLGEVGIVSVFGSEKRMPLSLLLTQKMQRYRFEEAQAIAALLFLFSIGSILCAFYFWKFKRSRE
jgi:thiamine transport system permease protein